MSTRAREAAPNEFALGAGRRRALSVLVAPWARVTAAGFAIALILVGLEGFHDAAQATVNGVVTGTYLALGAVGLALVFGVLRLINFAHGDMLTFGAYVGLAFNVTLGLPLAVAALVAVAATAVLGVSSELVLWRRMRRKGAGSFQLLLITIGLAFVIRNGIQIVAGSQPRSLNVDVTSAITLIDGVRIGRTELIVVAVGVAALVVTAAMLRATLIGRWMRALADNLELAEVSGIDTHRVILATWAIAGALAGLAGVLSAAAVGVMTPNFGWVLLLSLFAASVLGGIGSAYGALAGGLLLGLAEEWSTLFIDPRWKLAVGFAILVLTLLVRPNGLFGRPALQ